MKKTYSFDFDLVVKVKHLEITANNEEEAEEILQKMDAEDLISYGCVSKPKIENLEYGIAEVLKH
jgi:hypothetical protein